MTPLRGPLAPEADARDRGPACAAADGAPSGPTMRVELLTRRQRPLCCAASARGEQSPHSAATLSRRKGCHDGETRQHAQNAVTKLCLDDSTDNQGRDVLRTFPRNNLPYRQWSRGANNNIPRNLKTGRCLDYSFQFGLRAFPCASLTSPTPYQAWYSYVAYSSSPAHVHFQGGQGAVASTTARNSISGASVATTTNTRPGFRMSEQLIRRP